MILSITKFVMRDLLRGKWLLVFFLFFFVVTEGLLFLTAGEAKTVVGLMNVILMLIPLSAMMFGTLHVHQSRDFITLMLSQPVKRSSVFAALYLGISLPFVLAFAIGVTIPCIAHQFFTSPSIWILICSGCFLTFIFFAVSFLVAIRINDRSIGIGVAFTVWLLMAVVYDGLVLTASVLYQDYPMEVPTLIMVTLNPLDLARIIVMLTFDYGALMGYTGAIFERFYGSYTGIGVACGSLLLWVAVPLTLARRLFITKDW